LIGVSEEGYVFESVYLLKTHLIGHYHSDESGIMWNCINAEN